MTSPATADDIEVVAVVAVVAMLELPPQDASNEATHKAKTLLKKALTLERGKRCMKCPGIGSKDDLDILLSNNF